MPAAKHIHKYRRIEFKTGNVSYDCVWCSHLLPIARMAGRASICWECGEPFEITTKTLRYQKKPKCDACTGKSKEAEDIQDTLDLEKELKERIADANS